jgi:hypothetical protein
MKMRKGKLNEGIAETEKPNQQGVSEETDDVDNWWSIGRLAKEKESREQCKR